MDVFWYPSGEVIGIPSTMLFNSEFEKDVLSGLQRPKKQLLSKYFYDEIGSRIYQEIMQLDEYYLPRSEMEILCNQAGDIAALVPYHDFDIIELGAGDGSKTRHFLNELVQLQRDLTYYPLDISSEILEVNYRNMKQLIPGLKIHSIPGDYFDSLHKLKAHSPKLILFMGGNIGNYPNGAAIDFLKLIGSNMHPSDLLLVGIDLRKHPRKILAAYDDPLGVTKRFNLNILTRINRELGANFDISAFDHFPYYDPVSGITYSYLVSLKDQEVEIGQHKIHFEKFDLIHTEISQKYGLTEIDMLKSQAGFSTVKHFVDKKSYFSVSAFSK